ncbi:GDSL-type esterase/lipase family protein [Actinotalea sp. AC32]|nr:GDSL-type esterase/lipase family protein [Actinotalea sp. AC32]
MGAARRTPRRRTGGDVTGARICVVGDELVAGAGDPRGLGWVGRVAARTPAEPAPLVMTLAVPGETTTGLSSRWEVETALRFGPRSDSPHHLVVALGRADLSAGISLARSRLNLANVLDVAEQKQVATFVVGPPPGTHEDQGRQAELSSALGDVARRRGVPYVDTFTPLVHHEQWLADLASGDGRVPGQAGYGLMAWLVLHGGWHRWLGLPDDAA